MTLPAPIAVDAMGGDRAPDEIVAGAERAAAELDLPIVLVGDPDRLGSSSLPVIGASEVIAMHDDPGRGVRRKKDSSLVRAAEAVRDGRASAMVSAGNTGATWGAALLRMGRTKGVARPAIATPIPRPGVDTPLVLLDAGANTDCNAEWLVQFAQMGAAFARNRFGIEAPRVGLLSIGEEPGKGDSLRKETHALLAEGGWARAGVGAFVGNVEGRDLMGPDVDVVVTDGFTGNVALKSLEGAMRALVAAVLGAFDADAATRAAGEILMPALLPLYGQLDPDTTGGAVLLGVDGVCIISHGSSSATAIVNACRVAADSVTSDLVGAVTAAVGGPPTG
ncbi:phosphate acyltransferase PlsX [Iamia sp.]|uniref:phosphate acyltransferase PlsX n=1 Tax=Iamia sp. TaxID=2722710 RepID=UPI002B7BA123|nr:phosphate acyltransferase PlsX [Iamia sp.]HXH55987.1 phosphate acyltransferase PlsX [Iamia sp.]